MSLIKHRPRIHVHIPRLVHPGTALDVRVVLDAKRKLAMAGISIELRGREWVNLTSGGDGSVFSVTPVHQRASLRDKGELPAGRSQLSARFQLPDNLPPSFESDVASTTYELSVHVAIPWWPDAKRRYVLPIQVRPLALQRESSRIHTTKVGGPVSREAHVEFSLQDAQLTPGEALQGELALYNVSHNRYRQAQLSLVGQVERRSIQGTSYGSSPAFRYSIDVAIDEGREGVAIPFAMRLPKTLPPSYAAALWTLRWHFEVKLNIAWGNNLEAAVPVVVLPAASRVHGEVRAAARVGSQRVRRVWQRVAEENGLVVDGSALSLRRGERSLRIAPDHSGDYVTLQARLAYPTLGLGLDGGPRTGLRRVLQRGAPVDEGRWDKRHYLSARDAQQLHAFVAPLKTLLPLALLEDADDEHFIVCRRGGGQSYLHLAEFVRFALALHNALQQARQALPLPAVMQPAAHAWRSLARTLGGQLRQTDMAVSGKFDGRRAEVRTVWSSDNRPLRTELSLHCNQQVAKRQRLSLAAEAQHGSLKELPKAARAIATRLGERSISLTIAADRLVVWDAAPAMASEPLLDRLGEMAALERALAGGHGPYR